MAASRDDRISALPAHLREALRHRLAGNTSSSGGSGTIPALPRPGMAEVPLAPAQQRLWFLHEFAPDDLTYNASFGFRITGELRVDALRTALDGLAARHESLRTTFDTVAEGGVQRIHETGHIPAPLTDLSGLSPQDLQPELDRLVRAEVNRPFDLRTGPLVRALLVRLARDHHVLVLSLHHIIHDGWSLEVFIRELGELYRAEVTGGAPRLAPLPVQYADFSVWQREQLSTPDYSAQLEYWKNKLAGLSPLDLTPGQPRAAVRNSAGALHRFEIPPEVCAGLRALATGSGASLFMALTGAVQVLFSRWSGQDDIAVGTPMSGRGRPELDNVIGFFLNTVVLRSRVDLGQSFRRFLTEVRETVLSAFAHQDVPFDRIVETLRPERDTSRTPLVQAMVVLQNAPQTPLRLEGTEVVDYPLGHASATFDVLVGFQETTSASLAAVIEYATDLFDSAAIERMARHLSTLLTGIVADPDRPMWKLPLLPRDEFQLLTEQWARTTEPYPADCGVHELVRRQAMLDPAAVAVTAGAEALSYGELEARAGRLAAELAEYGVKPGVLVGIFLERSIDMVVCVLGVLKAGGAYVPLDPDFPEARLEYMLTDSAAPVVLTTRALRARVAAANTVVLCIDEDRPDVRRDADVDVGPGDLAYVVYTSGSTGQPKGVLVPHRGVCNIATAAARRFGLGPGTRVLQLAPFSFDGAVWEIFLALTSGAELCVADRITELSGTGLAELVRAEGTTLITLPPAALAAIDPESIPDRAVVVSAGERCPVDLAAAWSRRHRFLNGYGPTEVTVGATLHECAAVPAGGNRVPVGRPIPNVEVYLLDRWRNPVPVGVTGEVFIGGPGVALGYLNQPGLTAERFVPHPFRDDPELRVYRTGDLARWLPDGTLDFAGRTDNQVKIRSYRIELGEVEAVLARHPGVSEAVAMAREDNGRTYLVAYFVPCGPDAPNAAWLRDFVAEQLPSYMVPSAFVAVEQWPLTPAGKVDRSALPAPSQRGETGFVPPSAGAARTLAGIFSEVLGVPRVGAEDNFFDLGGDSILSMQVVAKAREAGLSFTTKDLFLNPTVERLAGVAAHTTPAEPEEAEPATGEAPLTPIQHWFFDNHGALDHFNQSVFVDLTPDLDESALRTALDAVFAHHDALRTRFGERNGEWTQWTDPEVKLELIRHSVSKMGDDAVSAAIEEAAAKAQAGLNVEGGRLAKAVLFAPEAGTAPSLFLTIHHLAVDGVSWRILLNDLEDAYQQAVKGIPVRLGPRTTAYGTWSARLAAYAAAGGFDDELDYWTGIADGETTALPIERQGVNRAGATETVQSCLDEAGTEALLRQLPGQYRARVNDILLAALAGALFRWTGGDRIVIDVEGHGREDILGDVDTSRTVGWFTAIYPVALSVPESGEWKHLIRQTTRALRKVPRHGLGYGALRYLRGARLASPAQVSFNYLGQWRSDTGTGLLRRQRDPVGRDHAPGLLRTHLLDITAGVDGDRLGVTWTYSPEMHARATIQRLADDFINTLRAAVHGGGS